MARIPDGVIERLKTEVSVQRLAEARGVVLSKHGADLQFRPVEQCFGERDPGLLTGGKYATAGVAQRLKVGSTAVMCG